MSGSFHTSKNATLITRESMKHRRDPTINVESAREKCTPDMWKHIFRKFYFVQKRRRPKAISQRYSGTSLPPVKRAGLSVNTRDAPLRYDPHASHSRRQSGRGGGEGLRLLINQTIRGCQSLPRVLYISAPLALNGYNPDRVVSQARRLTARIKATTHRSAHPQTATG